MKGKFLFFPLVALMISSCSSSKYSEAADLAEDVYSAIQKKDVEGLKKLEEKADKKADELKTKAMESSDMEAYRVSDVYHDINREAHSAARMLKKGEKADTTEINALARNVKDRANILKTCEEFVKDYKSLEEECKEFAKKHKHDKYDDLVSLDDYKKISLKSLELLDKMKSYENMDNFPSHERSEIERSSEAIGKIFLEMRK